MECVRLLTAFKGYDQETFNQLIEEEHSEATPKVNRGIVLNVKDLCLWTLIPMIFTSFNVVVSPANSTAIARGDFQSALTLLLPDRTHDNLNG